MADPDDIYYTLEREGSGKVTEKMSRFLSFALHAASAPQVKETLKRYAADYRDARHICWAYIIGEEGDQWQLNDNGEPSGTAGKPILGQIRSCGLTDTLVVVVRYFGGIKLGTSGLISAYREAARLALDDGGRRQCTKMAEITFSFPYLSMNDVMKIAKSGEVKIAAQEFGNSCRITLRCPRSMKEALAKRISDIDGASLDP